MRSLWENKRSLEGVCERCLLGGTFVRSLCCMSLYVSVTCLL